MTKNGFTPVIQDNFKSNHDKQAWNCVEEYALGEEYKGSYSELEAKLRTRLEGKFHEKHFNSMNARDTWKNRFDKSTSLRKGASDKILSKIQQLKAKFENEFDNPAPLNDIPKPFEDSFMADSITKKRNSSCSFRTQTLTGESRITKLSDLPIYRQIKEPNRNISFVNTRNYLCKAKYINPGIAIANKIIIRKQSLVDKNQQINKELKKLDKKRPPSDNFLSY